ncbi:leucine-rich repeat-containing protein 15-like [Lethenteron reissneri]|uniref:leucine-rich repeat-containing protein 15-like n=1 Tax=Lethenteron reissneri TaxID=7753 RepID=UPI002AB74D5C|nr:leucine-rich repeat-containing protein 15-like [Lethenteron reissneri]
MGAAQGSLAFVPTPIPTTTQELRLYNNQIRKLEPGLFDHLVNLQKLGVHNNQLKSVHRGMTDSGYARYSPTCSCSGTTVDCNSRSLASVPAGIPSTTQYLGLSSNQITKLEPGVFDSLTQLTYLSLHTNQLTALPEGVFDRLVNLQQLFLYQNRLSFIPAGMFDKLTNLKDLKLYSNQLTVLPEGLFNRLMNIVVLDLCCNKFTQLPTGIDKLAKLTLLALQGNQLKSVSDTKHDC